MSLYLSVFYNTLIGFNFFFHSFVLSELPEVLNMVTDDVISRIHTPILDTKIGTSFSDDGCNLGVVRLCDCGEQVVCSLVIKVSSENRPEPAVGGKIHGRSHLQFSPKTVACIIMLQYTKMINKSLKSVIHLWSSKWRHSTTPRACSRALTSQCETLYFHLV